MTDSRAERLARNEATFRSLNELIDTRVHASLGHRLSDLPGYVCECGDATCTTTVRVPPARYELIRSDPRRFLVAIGHVAPEVEDVVDRGPGFLVVRKHEEVADIVEATDPRTA